MGTHPTYIKRASWLFIIQKIFNVIVCFRRHAQDIRELYEQKLERTNKLYVELANLMVQLDKREKDIMKWVPGWSDQQIFIFKSFFVVALKVRREIHWDTLAHEISFFELIVVNLWYESRLNTNSDFWEVVQVKYKVKYKYLIPRKCQLF